MRSNQFIKKIRFYAFISFLLPLITINSCLLVYKFLGSFDAYAPFNWKEKKIVLTPEQEKLNQQNLGTWSFSNCPKYKVREYLITTDDQILNDEEIFRDDKLLYIVKEQGEIKNNRCVKNSRFIYFLLNNVKTLDNILMLAKEKNAKGFAEIKNPYFYGEVSISRTARFFPITYLFKPLIILSSIFLILYWKNNLNLFKEFEKQNILFKSSKTFFYFGICSCIFLILHAIFLGLDIESILFKKMRRVIIILFIFFELLAQVYLTRNLFKFREEIKKYINPLILKIKITFVAILIAITLVLLILMIWGDLSQAFKNISEWNYFSILLIYYFLSRLFWNASKTQVHTPEGV